MKRLVQITLVMISILSGAVVLAQNLTIDQEEQFRSKVRLLMQSYSDANQITNNFVTQDPKLVEQLQSSFVLTSSKTIYNDLLPTKIEGSRYLSPVDYIHYVRRNYPEGVDVRIDIQDILITGTPYKKGGYYEAIVRAKKTLRGLYGNARIHTFTDVLHFYISGILGDGTVDGLGITMVAENKKHSQVQADRRFKGFYVGASGGYNYSFLLSNELLRDNGRWYVQPFDPSDLSLLPAFELNYMFTRGFGLGAGLKIGKYSPVLTLDRLNGEVLGLFTDIDNDRYIPIYSIDELQEFRRIETYDIPILLKFRSGSKSVGLYLDLGIVYSMYQSMEYALDGTVTRKGRYPDYGNVVFEDIEIYNFYDNKTFSSTDSYTLPLPENGLSAFSSLGFSISPFKNVFIRLGVSASYGFQTDVSYNPNDHSLGLPKVDFYYTTGRSLGETLLNSVSADFGIYYRLLK